MKKLLLVAGGVLSTFELLASNFVPICSNIEDDKKTAIYKVIVENSFVTQLNSNNITKLSKEDKIEIINNESEFLKKKIQSVDSSAKVAFIPKSLYQLFVWNLFLDEFGSIENRKDREMFLGASVWGTWPTEGIALRENINGIDRNFCTDYMSKKLVKSYFWKINDSILPFLTGISTEEISEEINIKNITKNLLSTLPSKFKDIKNIHYDTAGISSLISFLKSINNKICEDLIIEESKAPENTYRIYTGERPQQDVVNGRVDNHSSSFSDGMFSGIILEPGKAMAFGYALSHSHMKCIDLPKEELLNAKEDSKGIETSGLSVYIPPVISMGATTEIGEYFHVRTKVKADTLENETSTINGIDAPASKKETPWYVTYSSPVERFWKKLKLSQEKTYKLSNEKDLNIKTYRWDSKLNSEKKETPWYATYSSLVENFWGKLKLSKETIYKLLNW